MRNVVTSGSSIAVPVALHLTISRPSVTQHQARFVSTKAFNERQRIELLGDQSQAMLGPRVHAVHHASHVPSAVTHQVYLCLVSKPSIHSQHSDVTQKIHYNKLATFSDDVPVTMLLFHDVCISLLLAHITCISNVIRLVILWPLR